VLALTAYFIEERDMATQSVEQELVQLEKDYWQALKDQDVDAAMRLTDDQCIVTGAQGVASLPREAFRGMLTDPSWTIEDYDITDVQARMLSDDVAIVAYKVKEELTVEGKLVTLEAADASTWVRRNGRWVCALHTEAITGDPFGRDRQQSQRAD
jgi:hypothetical protein